MRKIALGARSRGCRSFLRNNGIGIRAFSFRDAPISVNYIGPGITTQGGNGIGIAALSGGGNINVTSSGPITTSGSGAIGILADSTNLVARFPSELRATPVFNGTPTGTGAGECDECLDHGTVQHRDRRERGPRRDGQHCARRIGQWQLRGECRIILGQLPLVDVGGGARCRTRNVVLFENESAVRPTNRKCGLSRL
jgi:hypothetical protein